MNDEHDLSLVTTANLILELLERFEHGVIVLMRENRNGEGGHLYIRRHKGNSHTCVGLCQDVSDCILQCFHAHESKAEDI